jgi:hypothetical protein
MESPEEEDDAMAVELTADTKAIAGEVRRRRRAEAEGSVAKPYVRVWCLIA